MQKNSGIKILSVQGIKVNVSAKDVSMDHIRDFDIAAIFANLRDNAIDACDKVNENKYITMDTLFLT